MKNDKIQVSLRMDEELYEKIISLKEGTERNLSQQIQWMLKQYIKIIEQSKL